MGRRRTLVGLAAGMGGKRTLSTAEEQQPRQDDVGEHLDDDQPFGKGAALCSASSPFSALQAIAHSGEREQRPCQYDVGKSPPANRDDPLAVHFD